MNSEHKKYIFENMGKKSAAWIASELGIRERKVRRAIEEQRNKGVIKHASQQEAPPTAAALPIKKTFVLASIALIIILGFAVYANSLNGKFVYDDENLIVNNVSIKDRSILLKVLTEDIGKGAGKKTDYYRPIQIITYAMDYSLWKLNAFGYHLTNIILHILVALCIYWLVNMLFDDKAVSVLAAAFFTVHPIHTTVVSYISTRADSICLLFMLISFIFYIKSIHDKGVLSFLIMILSYSLGLLSKENALILPALLLLYNYTFMEKIRIRELLSISGVTVLYISFRMTILKYSISDTVIKNTLFERIPGFFVAIAAYFRIILIPFGLHIEYGKKLFSITDPLAISGLIILGALIFYIIKTMKTDRLIFFSLSWFIITLFPVSNLYPLNAYMSENWLYLPSVGIFLVMAGLLRELYKKEKVRIPARIFTAGLLVFYSCLTIGQNCTWADPISFYERTLGYAPDSPRMYNNLGGIYEKTGRKEDAIAMYKKAIELNPNYADAYNNLANMYDKTGRKEDAIAMYKKSIEFNPNNAEAYNNFGFAYYKMGKKEDAIAMYKKARELNPNSAEVYNNLGITYYEKGEIEEAAVMYKKAIGLNPYIAEIYNNLGAAYFAMNKRDEAVSVLKKALEINPDYEEARRNLEIITGGSKKEAPQ